MASDNQLTIKISANSAGAEAGLKRAQSEISKLQNVASSVGSKVGSVMGAIGSKVVDGVKAVVSQSSKLLTTGLTAAFTGLVSQAGSAIKRLDTFQQYPRVLQALGVSADEAQKSIERIDKSVQGLPTSLNDAVAGVQGFFTATQNLELSEKLFTAANNAALTFSQDPVQAINSFSRAYQQALARGAIHAEEFNTINEAIPGLMSVVSKQTGKSMDELRDANNEGHISLEELNNALITLNEKGGAGVDAFSKTAYAASGGIATTFTNMKTAVIRGVADVISGLDGMPEAAAGAGKAIEQLLKGTMNPSQAATLISGFTDTILNGVLGIAAQIIPAVAGVISNAIGTIATQLPTLVPLFVQGVLQIVNALAQALPNILQAIINSIPVIITGVMQIFQTITSIMPQLVSQLVGAITSILGDSSTINALLQAAFDAFMAIVNAIPQVLSALVAVLPDLLLTIISFVTNPSTLNALLDAALQLLMAIVDAIPQIIVALVNALPTIIANLIAFLVSPSTITQLINAAVQMLLSLVKAIPQIIVALVGALPEIILNLINFFTDPSTLKMMIDAAVQLFMSLVTAIPQILSALINAFGSLFGRLWDSLQGIFSNFGVRFGDGITSVFKNAVNGVLGFLEGFINGPIDLINSAIGAINNIPGVNIGTIPRVGLPRLQQGGILEGNSYTGDKQMFMGNAGEMVINRTQQGSLWRMLSNGQFGNSNDNSKSVVIDNLVIQVQSNGDPEQDGIAIAKAMLKEFVSQGLAPDLRNAGALR